MAVTMQLSAEQRYRLMTAISDEWTSGMKLISRAGLGKSALLLLPSLAKECGWEKLENKQPRRQPVTMYRRGS